MDSARSGRRAAAPPLVSVVVVAWNSDHELANCLASVRESSVPIQLIVVDNASRDQSAQIASDRSDLVLRNDENVGFARGVNLALPHCVGLYVLLLNPDVVVGPGAIEQMVDVIAHDTTVGLVGPNLVRPDGSADPSAARRDATLRGLAITSTGLAHMIPNLDPTAISRRGHDSDVDCISGACALLRTDLLARLGGLDETSFMYLEDQELCRSVRREGLRVRFVADARATHAVGGSTRRTSAENQVAAHLHRLDADLLAAARGREWARRVGVGLLAIQAVIAIAHGFFTKDSLRQAKWRAALRWLAMQVPHRHAPRTVPH